MLSLFLEVETKVEAEEQRTRMMQRNGEAFGAGGAAGPSAATGLKVHLVAEAHQSDTQFSHFMLCHLTFIITCCIVL